MSVIRVCDSSKTQLLVIPTTQLNYKIVDL